ncbi:fimbria/pilus outer membrane usher protein [Atlantibacter hermannii]|uniref:fimbria/pilus outer membrane usher protein n=1 Tax=Atlantibacter hermannii TaxID=565 RepID=UPI0028A64EF5|nr:fimbria/pilus outer membrane usher protein [Atlantibacter hermannii]MCQ4967844.1 fimbrial biogenesis outer membrane usher protein [Enterobacteriaceae bacterium DFI.7.85]
MSALHPKYFKVKKLPCLISCLLAVVAFNSKSYARDYFNPVLLEIDNPGGPDSSKVDLSSFENGQQQPGIYHVDLYLNRDMVDTYDINFEEKVNAAGEKELQPCLSAELLKKLGVKVNLFPGIKADDKCVYLPAVIPQASANLVFNQQRLDVSIPQAALDHTARNYIPPEKWDYGIPALLVNYDFNGVNSKARDNQGVDYDNYYLNLRSGINLGTWRLRNYSTWSRDSEGVQHWNTINSWVQKDIPALRSQFVAGESSSTSDVFDSVPFRGAQVASDDDMLPDNMTGYSPVVRGIAKTNAQVIIRQNGYVIYQSYVAPGAFEINDLYPASGSGDLFVTIKESDGSERSFTVAYAAVPVLQREGHLKYSLTAGKYRSNSNNAEEPMFYQGTVIYGLPHGATVYSGLQYADKYRALVLGWGQNLGAIGAISADVTQANTQRSASGDANGQSWRLRYGKNFVDTGTNFSLASYRYSTKGFYTFQEAMEGYSGNSDYYNDHKRSRMDVTLSQNIGPSLGSISLSLIKENYWNRNRDMKSASVGYNNNYGGVSYSVNYSYNKNGYDQDGQQMDQADHMFAINVNVPLSIFDRNTRAWASWNMSSSKNGSTVNNVGINGTLLDGNNLSYSVNQTYTSQDHVYGGYANLGYTGERGSLSGNYAYDKHQQTLNYDLRGGLLLHENGLTLSQEMDETVALIKAPDTHGARISNNLGVSTDTRGYAVIPYLTPYRETDIELDTETLNDDVDTTISSHKVIPARGSVVRVDFDTKAGQRVLFTLMTEENKYVPFGAIASVDGKKSNTISNIVGDGGQIYLSGLEDSGALSVSWGEDVKQQCHLNYALPPLAPASGIQMVKATCHYKINRSGNPS